MNYNVRNVIAAYLKAHQLKLESAKKFANLQKLIFFIAKSSYIVKMFANKICPKNKNLYIFEKPLTMPSQICKIFCKILINLIFHEEKLKMCKLPLTGCLQKLCNFFLAKLVQLVSLCQKLSKKLNFIKIWQVKVGQNKDFICYMKKAVIQAVCLKTQAVSIKVRF